MKNVDIEQRATLPEIIGMPKKGIIFSDLDGVWFDENANFSEPEKSDLLVLQEARDAGYWLVLNSDTAPDTLADFAKDLSFDPIVIGENGTIIYIPSIGLTEYLSPFKNFFDQYRTDIVTKLTLEKPDATLFVGDATKFIKQIGSIPAGTAESMYLINSSRKCSTGVYTREVQKDGTLIVNDALTQETEKLLNDLLRDKPEASKISCFRYPNLGSCLVKEPSQAKWKGVKWIIDQFPKDLSYYMIGDRIYDSMEPLGNQVTTCAVGNAGQELKDSVKRTNGIQAPSELTIAKGANYIIRKIIEGDRT